VSIEASVSLLGAIGQCNGACQTLISKSGDISKPTYVSFKYVMEICQYHLSDLFTKNQSLQETGSERNGILTKELCSKEND
jgi:hypothetical protein